MKHFQGLSIPTAIPFLHRASRKPSPYPVLYHILHIAQLLCALIVASVLTFFIDHLRDEGFKVPWTFSLLLTTSLLTLLHLLASFYVDLTRTVNPATHLLSNAVLTVCWLVSLALLTWNLSWTLGHRCVVTRWHNEAGIMICRMYKALAAFAVCGTAATICALTLDITVRRKTRERGAYNPMGKGGQTPIIKVGEGSEHGQELRSFGEGFERRSHEGARQYKVQKPIEAKQFGYEAPTEQTEYGRGR